MFRTKVGNIYIYFIIPAYASDSLFFYKFWIRFPNHQGVTGALHTWGFWTVCSTPDCDMFFRSYRIGFMSPSCGTLYMFYGECDWDYLSFMSIELYPHEIINLHLHHHFQPAPLAQGRRGSMSERLTLPSGCGLLLLAAVTQWTPHGCRKGQGSHCVWMDSLSRNRMRTVTKHCVHIEGCQSPSGYHFGPGH